MKPKTGDMPEQDALLDALKRKFEEAEEAGTTGRDLAAKCRDYYDGRQLTQDQEAEYAKRQQPPSVNNRVRRKVDWLRGLEMQSRTDPRAFPRTPEHQQGAEAATDALRFVADQTDWDRKRSACWGDMLIEGVGAVEIIHSGDDADPEIIINHYPADRCFWDPHSRRADMSDAQYLGVVIWTDKDVLARSFPDKAEMIGDSATRGGSPTGQFEDIPEWAQWSDSTRQRVRQVLMHYRDGAKWRWALFVAGGILAEGDSPYVDNKRRSLCPMEMQSAYVDREGMRYGIVRDMIYPQDAVNMRESKLLHMLNTRQTMAAKGVVDARKVKTELSKANGHVEWDADAVTDLPAGMKPFDIIPQSDQISGQFALLQESKQEIDLMGANSGLAGKDQTASQSGRAILARQQGGMIEIAPLTDGLSDFTRRVYRQIWWRIRQLWRAEKWVRVTDDERNVRFVGFNRPVTLADKIGEMPPEMQAAAIRQMGLMPGDPRLSQVVGVQNPVEEMDVDIILEEVPDTVTMEAETFQAVASVAQAMPGSVPPEVLIEITPGLKRDVKDKLLKHLESQQAQQAQNAQQMQALAIEKAQGETAKTQAAVQKDTATAAKTTIEAQRLAMGY